MLLQISVIYQTGNLSFSAYANWHINIQSICSESKKRITDLKHSFLQMLNKVFKG